MVQLLGLVLISFALTSLLLVPFIDLLFHLRRKYKRAYEPAMISKDTPISNTLLKGKDLNTPAAGGLLVIPIVIGLCLLVLFFSKYVFGKDIQIIFLTLLLFGSIGCVDDIRKLFSHVSGKFSGLRGRYILILQIFFATIISLLLYYSIGLNNIFVPLIGNVVLDWLYIPLAVFTIVSFSNAYNVSDGLDGLSTGLLMICLFAFLVLASSVFNYSLSVFLGIWIGALIAYLYFNVFPARIYLGDAGAYGFGATLAVVGLLTGKIIGLGVIGGVYVIIITSSLLQMLSKRILKRKIMPVSPVHMYFKYIGWEEPKIVTRFWLAGIIFATLGLWLAFLSN